LESIPFGLGQLVKPLISSRRLIERLIGRKVAWGIGLMMVQRLVELHGEIVEAHSIAGYWLAGYERM